MGLAILFLVVFLLGVLVGGLVFRNNPEKSKALLDKAEEEARKLK